MTSMMILEQDVPVSSPDFSRVLSVLERLSAEGFAISRMRASASENPAVLRLLEQKGEKILPITLVNNFPMITGRYPSNEEIKQILSVPDGILEPKQCGCCCIEGCCCE